MRRESYTKAYLDQRIFQQKITFTASTKSIAGLAIAFTALSLLYISIAVGAPLRLGGDEGYELMKGLLLEKGYSLYTQIWNDQPPVFTILLSGAFHAFGKTAFVGRSVAAAFGFLLFLSFHTMVMKRSGSWAGFVAALLLLASPGVLLLSASAMLEVPALALAFASGWLVFLWRERHGAHWLLGSGVVMGLALGTKLTAVIVAPAIVTEILLQHRASSRRGWFRLALLAMIRWGMSALGTVLVINFFWGAGKLSVVLPLAFHQPIRPCTGSTKRLSLSTNCFPGASRMRRCRCCGAGPGLSA